MVFQYNREKLILSKAVCKNYETLLIHKCHDSLNILPQVTQIPRIQISSDTHKSLLPKGFLSFLSESRSNSNSFYIFLKCIRVQILSNIIGKCIPCNWPNINNLFLIAFSIREIQTKSFTTSVLVSILKVLSSRSNIIFMKFNKVHKRPKVNLAM